MTTDDATAASRVEVRVTITEIARQAGVSVPTVSRVVNGRSDVSPRTRARVEDLLQLHGYRKRPASAPTRASLLDLVFNDLDSPWAVEIIRGVEEAAHAAGVGTVVSAIHGRSGDAREWMRNLRSRASDGVVLVTSALEPTLHEQLRVLGVPLVVVDPTGSPAADTATVGAANWAGGLAATEHLLSLGPPQDRPDRGPARLLCSRARFDGYRAALEAAGLAVDDALVVPGRLPPRIGLHRLQRPARPARTADRGVRGQRPDGARGDRGAAPARAADAGGHERGRLRRPAGGPLVGPAADHRPPAPGRDGQTRRPHGFEPGPRRAPRLAAGGAGHGAGGAVQHRAAPWRQGLTFAS